MSKIKFFPISFILLFLMFSCSKEEVKQLSNQRNIVSKIINPSKYIANPKTSVLTWIGKKVSSGHNGTVLLSDGFLNVSADGSIHGEFNIDMNSISVLDLQGRGKAGLERHLKNEDFFSVEDFPLSNIIFRSNKNQIINNQIDLQASLTIKNFTHPLNFTATIIEVSPKLKLNADIIFDRSLYEVKYGSGKFFDNLGDRLILDEIQIGVDLEFN